MTTHGETPGRGTPDGGPSSSSDPDSVTWHDESDLAASLVGLAGLASHGAGLEAVLTRIAAYAVQAIPNADGAGLTLLEAKRADIIVKSAPFVVEVDDFQYSLGEGPCIDAAAQARTMRSGSLGGDPRWPRFGPRVGRLGVHSVLSLPLITPTGVVGAMNVYAHAKDAFDEGAERIGELFAAPAAITVQNAQILAQAQRLADHLQAALTSRAIIDQAVGILRSRGGISSEEAFDRLRRISQHEHRRLADVAASLVQEAVSRARAHRRPTPPEGPRGTNQGDPRAASSHPGSEVWRDAAGWQRYSQYGCTSSPAAPPRLHEPPERASVSPARAQAARLDG